MYCSMIFFQRYVSREVAVLKLGFFSKRLKVNFGNGPETCKLQAGWISLRVCNNCSLIEAEATKDLEVEEAVLSGFFHLSVRTAF